MQMAACACSAWVHRAGIARQRSHHSCSLGNRLAILRPRGPRCVRGARVASAGPTLRPRGPRCVRGPQYPVWTAGCRVQGMSASVGFINAGGMQQWLGRVTVSATGEHANEIWLEGSGGPTGDSLFPATVPAASVPGPCFNLLCAPATRSSSLLRANRWPWTGAAMVLRATWQASTCVHHLTKSPINEF